MDGLLIDTETISYQVYRDLTGKFGREISMEEYIHDYSGRTGLDNMKRMTRAFQLPVTVEEGIAFADGKEREYLRQGVSLKKGARELLAYLKRHSYQILLASSSSRERAIDILSRNGIGAFFDDMVFGADIPRGKPYPDIFLKACAYAGEPAENCLVLEDSEAGIQAAFSAGIDVICIPDLKMPGKEYRKMAAAQLSSLHEVVQWLERRYCSQSEQ